MPSPDLRGRCVGATLLVMALRLALVFLAALVAPAVALAADIRLVEASKLNPKGGPLVIRVDGSIEPGDAAKFVVAADRAADTGRDFLGVSLNSPGGSLREGLRLGQAIRDRKMRTILLSGNQCASACVLGLAGGTWKLIFKGARIGVHGASIDGRETNDALAGTVAMAWLAAQLGVPDSIIVKMVTIPGDRIEWLGPEETTAIAGPKGMIDRFNYDDGTGR